MQTLKQAFLAAYQQTTKNHTCEMCPMHQLHRLCEDIDSKYHCVKKSTIRYVTTMLATSRNVLFPVHNHVLTTSTDDPTL